MIIESGPTRGSTRVSAKPASVSPTDALGAGKVEAFTSLRSLTLYNIFSCHSESGLERHIRRFMWEI
jgi:hypothetical protein